MSEIGNWLWTLPVTLFLWALRTLSIQSKEIENLKGRMDNSVTFEDMVNQNDTFFKKMDAQNRKTDEHYARMDTKIDGINTRITDITTKIIKPGE